MKIFVGGSKMIPDIDENIRKNLFEIIKNEYEVLVGDCRGVDTSVQQFFAENNYHNVIVYATGNTVRNNVGDFRVCNIAADGAEGFEFYRKKDIAMANESDCGLMIWDKKSKGTLCNIVDLLNQEKHVEVYFPDEKIFKTADGSKILGSLTYDAYEEVINILK